MIKFMYRDMHKSFVPKDVIPENRSQLLRCKTNFYRMFLNPILKKATREAINKISYTAAYLDCPNQDLKFLIKFHCVPKNFKPII